MEAASRMGKNLCFRITLTSGILACLVLSISLPAIAAPTALISDSGQKLASVFEGLKPNPQVANFQPVRPLWRGNLQSRLPGLMRVSITETPFCPTSTCEGNYAVIEPSPGGCHSDGCPAVNNFITDTQQGSCFQGAMDIECGDGIIDPCCANWEDCPAKNTIGCPKN